MKKAKKKPTGPVTRAEFNVLSLTLALLQERCREMDQDITKAFKHILELEKFVKESFQEIHGHNKVVTQQLTTLAHKLIPREKLLELVPPPDDKE